MENVRLEYMKGSINNMNKIEDLIDTLKEDVYELFHKERSKEQQIELFLKMIEESLNLKEELEGKLRELSVNS